MNYRITGIKVSDIPIKMEVEFPEDFAQKEEVVQVSNRVNSLETPLIMTAKVASDLAFESGMTSPESLTAEIDTHSIWSTDHVTIPIKGIYRFSILFQIGAVSFQHGLFQGGIKRSESGQPGYYIWGLTSAYFRAEDDDTINGKILSGSQIISCEIGDVFKPLIIANFPLEITLKTKSFFMCELLKRTA